MDGKSNVIFIAVALLMPVAALADGNYPPDIRAFMENAETCEHLAGEYDGSLPSENKKEIEQGIEKYCGKAHKQMQLLRKKYSDNNAITDLISKYEAVASYRE